MNAVCSEPPPHARCRSHATYRAAAILRSLPSVCASLIWLGGVTAAVSPRIRTSRAASVLLSVAAEHHHLAHALRRPSLPDVSCAAAVAAPDQRAVPHRASCLTICASARIITRFSPHTCGLGAIIPLSCCLPHRKLYTKPGSSLPRASPSLALINAVRLPATCRFHGARRIPTVCNANAVAAETYAWDCLLYAPRRAYAADGRNVHLYHISATLASSLLACVYYDAPRSAGTAV